jgi:hypothetical protein
MGLEDVEYLRSMDRDFGPGLVIVGDLSQPHQKIFLVLQQSLRKKDF